MRDVAEWVKQPTRWPRTAAREWTASGRVLPALVLAGVQKGGTTSLYQQLRVHPHVLWARSKGAHYFDLHHHRSLDWYRSCFPHRWRVALRKARVGAPVITAESTGYYFDHPLAPARCAATLPEAKVVIMLRNPVKRAYSAYHDAVGKGTETLSFADAIDAEAERLDGEFERLASDPDYDSPAYRHHGYLNRSRYADHVDRWRAAVGPDHVLVMNSEDFYRDMASEYARVLEFVGLPVWAPANFERANTASYEAIAPEVAERLAAMFAPHNQRLYDSLGVDFGWD